MTDRVTELLIKHPAYRANKYKVIAHILWEELPISLKTPETKDVLRLIARGGLPATETISRAWRKVIELHPAWKTDDLEKIKRRQEEEVKADLRTIGKLEKL